MEILDQELANLALTIVPSVIMILLARNVTKDITYKTEFAKLTVTTDQ
jgi:hypothetical protein